MAKKVAKKKTNDPKVSPPTSAAKIAVKPRATAGKKAVKTARKKTVRKPILVKKEIEQPDIRPEDLKTYLSKAELDYFRELMLKKLRQINGDVEHIAREALHKSRQDASGDLSCMPIHMADIGSDNYEQEFSLGLMDAERKVVEEILMALRRIEEGSYGMCEGTGEPIPKARLEAYPWARYCVRYAEMIEKGQVVEVRNNNYSDRSDESFDSDDDDNPRDEQDAYDFEDDDDAQTHYN